MFSGIMSHLFFVVGCVTAIVTPSGVPPTHFRTSVFRDGCPTHQNVTKHGSKKGIETERFHEKTNFEAKGWKMEHKRCQEGAKRNPNGGRGY